MPPSSDHPQTVSSTESGRPPSGPEVGELAGPQGAASEPSTDETEEPVVHSDAADEVSSDISSSSSSDIEPSAPSSDSATSDASASPEQSRASDEASDGGSKDGAESIASDPCDPRWNPPLPTQLLLTATALFLEGASFVAALQFASYHHVVKFVLHNRMSTPDRTLILATAAGGGVLALLLAGGYVGWRRTRQAWEQVRTAARLLSPFILAMGIPILFNWKAYRSKTLLAVVVFTLFGLGAELALRTFVNAFPVDWFRDLFRRVGERFQRLGKVVATAVRWAPSLLVGIGAGAFSGYFSYYTILHHHRLQTQSLDMAIFNHMMWSLLRGAPFPGTPILGPHGTHLQYHATFVAVLLAPFYALYQKPEALQVIQATLLGLAAIPLYLLTRRRLGNSWLAAIVAFAYLFYAPLHGPIFYDFHFLTIAPFFVFWVLYLYERESRWGLVILWIVALSVREDVAAMLTMTFLFYLASGRRVRWALLGGVASLAYFAVMKFGVMPLFRGGRETFTYIYNGYIPRGEHGFGAVLRTFASNPVFTFSKLLNEKKLIYVLQVLGPVLLLPLRNKRAWLLLVFPALITIMSSGYEPVYKITFQYTAAWASFGLFGTVVVLSCWKARDGNLKRVTGSVLALAVASLLFSYHYGAVLQRHTFRGGFRRVIFKMSEHDRQEYRDLYALIAKIPPDAKVVATEREAPHLSSRRYIYTMRFGCYDAEYMLVRNSEVRSNFARKAFLKCALSGKYGFVTRRGAFSLWKRGAPKDHNGEELKRIGLHL